MNYWLPLLACLVGGMTLKWLLDLFFLRAHFARLERQASGREADYIALKHDHSRVLTDFKNKLTELDATAKAKSLAESTLSKRDSDLTALRSHLTTLEAELAASRLREASANEHLYAREKDFANATRALAGAQLEVQERTAAQEDLRLRHAEITAAAQTSAEALTVSRAYCETISLAANIATEKLARLEAEIASQQSVATTLIAAVCSRDAQITDLKARCGALEDENKAAATSQSAADQDFASIRTQLAEFKARLRFADEAEAAQKKELIRLQTELGLQNQARATTETALKQREIEVAEGERKASEYQRVLESAAVEHRRVAAELARLKMDEIAAAQHRADLSHRLETAEAQLVKVRRRAEQADALEIERAALAKELQVARTTPMQPLPLPLPASAVSSTPVGAGLEHRIQDLEAEIEAVSRSHAKLEADLAAERQRSEDLETRLNSDTLKAAVNPGAPRPVSPSGSETQWLTEIDELNRERNALAAELAALKATLPSPRTSSTTRRKKSKPTTPPAVELFPAPPTEVELATPSATTVPPARSAPEDAVIEVSARCPQHLSDVSGIGSSFEQRLYAAGVGSFWALSQLPDRTLGDMLELDEPQRGQFDFEAVRADALRLARETRSVGRKWSGDTPDDLEPLEGIGRGYEQKLYHAGICTYAALAAATPELLAEVCPSSSSKKPNYAHWIEQARQLVGGEEN